MRKLFCAAFIVLSASLGVIVAQTETQNASTEYISKYKEVAIQQMEQYRIPASITLAQGILESGNGKSELARIANNHFGIKCKTEWSGEKYYYDDDEAHECFRKYPSDTASFIDHSLFLSTRERYASLFELEITDYKGWAKGLKAAGYATNPAYAESLIALIEKYRLYEYDVPLVLAETDSSSSEDYVVVAVLSNNYIKEEPSLITIDTIEFDEIALVEGRRDIILINGVRCTIAKKGDDLAAIGHDVGLSSVELADFNDMTREIVVRAGDIVYVERKKKTAADEFHIVKEGDSWHSISQQYAIRLKSLLKLNGQRTETNIIEGQKLLLR